MAKKPKPTIALPEFVSLPEAAALANVSERHMRLLVNKRHPTLGRPKGT